MVFSLKSELEVLRGEIRRMSNDSVNERKKWEDERKRWKEIMDIEKKSFQSQIDLQKRVFSLCRMMS